MINKEDGNANFHNQFGMPTGVWSGLALGELTRHRNANKNKSIRFEGIISENAKTANTNLYVPKTFMKIASVPENTEAIQFCVYPSTLPIKEIGFQGHPRTVSVDTTAWEYELTTRREHAGNSWIYDTHDQEGSQYSYYFPKEITGPQNPPTRIMLEIIESPLPFLKTSQ